MISNKQYSIFLLAILLLLIGPNNTVIFLDLNYYLFYIIIIGLFVLHGAPVSPVPLIVSLPFIAAFLSYVTKLSFGVETGLKDVWFFIRYFNLIFIYLLVNKLFSKLNNMKIFEFVSTRLYSVVIIVITIISFVGLLQYFNVDLTSLPWFKYFYKINLTNFKGQIISSFEYSSSIGRINAIYKSPLAFASILMFLILFLFVKESNRRIAFFLIFIFASVVLFLTGSRAVFVSFLFSLFLFWFYKSSNKTRLFRLVFYLFGVFVIGFYLLNYIPSYYLGRFSELLESNQVMGVSSMDARFFDMRIIWNKIMVNDYWIYGIPLNQWQKLGNLSSGNQWFTWVQFYGVFAILFFIWYIYLPFKYFYLFIKTKDIYLRKFALVLFIIFVAGNISNLTQVSALLPRWREFMFVLISIAYVMEKNAKVKIILDAKKR